jgi:hypothetical protein
MNGVIQSSNAVLFIFKNDWVPFLCITDLSIVLSPDVISTRTPGAGHWAKNAYQKLNWSVSASSAFLYNQAGDSNFGGMDAMQNAFGFTSLKLRIVYTDEQANIKSVQGYGIINGLTWAGSSGTIVKSDLSIIGDGELKFFDGLIPCDSLITTITVAGQTAADGIVHVTYTFSGAPYQVKYRVDGTGNYIYALVGTTLDIPNLAIGSHSIEIIPVCLNNYESETSTSQAFVVTQALTCPSVITNITITSTTATPVYTGTPNLNKYRIDGGMWNYGPISAAVPLGLLSVGSHTIEMIPICFNGVEGTGFIKTFTVSAQPSQSPVNYNFASWTSGNIFQIYVNGILNISISTSTSGSIIVPTGALVKGILQGNNAIGSHAQLQTQDSTLLSVLDNRSGTCFIILQYSFIANGDTYFIQGTITP